MSDSLSPGKQRERITYDFTKKELAVRAGKDLEV